MKVIVDTSVWSLFLRRGRDAESPSLAILRQTIKEKSVQMLGIVRQELLSGIRSEGQFKRMEHLLESFPDLLAASEDHTEAAKFFNLCRRKGIQGSPIDFLICAQAYRHEMAILTDDLDFEQYAKHLPIYLVK